MARKESVRELPRRERKAYSQLRRSFRAEVLWFELSKVCRDPQLEEDVRIHLIRRKRKRSSEEEVILPTTNFFNDKLACFNAIKSCNMSMAAWDNLCLWIKDYNSHGGTFLTCLAAPHFVLTGTAWCLMAFCVLPLLLGSLYRMFSTILLRGFYFDLILKTFWTSWKMVQFLNFYGSGEWMVRQVIIIILII